MCSNDWLLIAVVGRCEVSYTVIRMHYLSLLDVLKENADVSMYNNLGYSSP